MVKLFLETGLLEEATDPDDRRSKRIYSPGDVSQKKEDSDEFTAQENLELILECLDTQPSDPRTEEIADELRLDARAKEFYRKV